MKGTLKILLFSAGYFIVTFLRTYEEYSVRSLESINPFQVYAFLLFLFLIMLSAPGFIIKSSLKAYLHVPVVKYFVGLAFVSSFVGLFSLEYLVDNVQWTILQLILIFAVMTFVSEKNENAIEPLLYAIFFTSLIASVLAILTLFTSFGIGPFLFKQPYFFRISGWFRSGNHFASLLGPGIISAMYLYRKQEQTMKKFLILVGIVSILSTLLLSGSRGGFVSLVFSLFLFIFLFEKQSVAKVRATITTILYVGIFAVIFGLFITATYFDMDILLEESFRVNEDIETDARMHIWEKAFKNYQKGDIINHLFGYGRGESVNLAGRSTHNSYLTMLFEFGIFYFVLFFFILRYLFQFYRKARRYETNLNSLVISMNAFLMLRSLTNNGIIGFNNETFIFYAINIWYVMYLLRKQSLNKVNVKNTVYPYKQP